MLAYNILKEVFHLSNIYSIESCYTIHSNFFFFCMYAFQCNSTHTLNHFLFCVELNLWSVHCIHFVYIGWNISTQVNCYTIPDIPIDSMVGLFILVGYICAGPCNYIYIVSMQSQLLVWSHTVLCNWSLHSLHWSACLWWLLHGLSWGFCMQTWVVLLVSAATMH